MGFPAALASEGNPVAGGGFPGEFDPYVHTVKDTMDVDDETGYFSLDVSPLLLHYPASESPLLMLRLGQHMARFSELAIAFVVEQAGWDNKWR